MDQSTLNQPSRKSSMFPRVLTFSVCSLLLLCFTGSVLAAQVSLAWNAVVDPDLDGYILYYGFASQNYTVSLDVGNNTTAALSGLEAGRKYYFGATAQDVYGEESPYSNEVSYTVPVTDATSPTVAITSPANGTSVPRRTTITISATASDNVAVTKVEFYINQQLTCTDVQTLYTCNWRVPRTSRRTYQLQAKAYDAQGNIGSSSVVSVNSQ